MTTPGHSGNELRQYLVHSEQEFEGVVDKVSGERNLYSSLSTYVPVKRNTEFQGCAIKSGKVSFDFDSSAKAPEEADYRWDHPTIPKEASDNEVVQKMKSDSDVRQAVLKDVCHNVRELAEDCIDKEIPIFGVFSGFGIHVHQLWEPTMSRVSDKMLSTVNKWVSELGLSCADERASGRPFRIMRVPNIERICHDEEIGTGLYTIPLKAAELARIEPEMLVDLSLSPRPEIGSEPDSRPQMKVHEDYLGPGYDEGVGQEKMRPIPEKTPAEQLAQKIIKETVQMPCVYERAFGRNPPNDVRVKLGIMLLNAGYSVNEATELIGRLNWVDFDRETTQYQLKKLKQSGKGDWSCKTMQAKGLCTRADKKEECPTYGYQGGNSPWLT